MYNDNNNSDIKIINKSTARTTNQNNNTNNYSSHNKSGNSNLQQY